MTTNFINTSNLTINQCKVMIQNYYETIYHLKSLSADTFLNFSAEGIESSLHQMQTGISKIHSNNKNLKRKLHIRKLKRLKIRNAKYKIRENLEKNRTELHNKINNNLEYLEEQSTLQLRKNEKIENANLKIKHLDKKIENSINKQSIINGLIVLRTLRANEHANFTGDLSVLQNQLKNHISKLQIAKKLLENSKRNSVNESRYTTDLCEKLFSDRNFQPNPLDRMSIDKLIEVRKYWDQFIVNDCDPDGSYIPKYWVGELDESN